MKNLVYNGVTISDVMGSMNYNGTNLERVYYNNVLVWERQPYYVWKRYWRYDNYKTVYSLGWESYRTYMQWENFEGGPRWYGSDRYRNVSFNENTAEITFYDKLAYGAAPDPYYAILSNGDKIRVHEWYAFNVGTGEEEPTYVLSRPKITSSQVFSHHSAGVYIDEVVSTNRYAYPDNAASGDFYYIYNRSY